MKVWINEQPFERETGCTLSEILEQTNMNTEYAAVAVDYVVIPRKAWASTLLQDGAQIMVIRASQGG